jgi:hypothetical protein
MVHVDRAHENAAVSQTQAALPETFVVENLVELRCKCQSLLWYENGASRSSILRVLRASVELSRISFVHLTVLEVEIHLAIRQVFEKCIDHLHGRIHIATR